MTPLMPDAPAPQNAMMQPPGGTPAGGMAPGGMMPPPNAMMAPQAAPAPAPSPAEIAEARKHLGAIMDALTSVASKPRGDLTKKDVFDAAAEMIAKGGFPTATSRQSLIVTLANMPDDEPALRKEIGRMMLRVAQVREAFHGVHGTGQPASNSQPTQANPAQFPPNAGQLAANPAQLAPTMPGAA